MTSKHWRKITSSPEFYTQPNCRANVREEQTHFQAGMFFKILTSSIHGFLEKAMAPQSSTLAWKIPWMEEPGGLQSMGSLRVGHDWMILLSLFTFMHWKRKWQPTPVFLPGESQGWGSLVGCHLWGCTESDTTEATWKQQLQHSWFLRKLLQEMVWQREGVIQDKTAPFLVVQWLRGHLSTQVVQVPRLVGELRHPQATGKLGWQTWTREALDKPTCRGSAKREARVARKMQLRINKWSYIFKNKNWRQDDMGSMKQGTQHRREGKKHFLDEEEKE